MKKKNLFYSSILLLVFISGIACTREKTFNQNQRQLPIHKYIGYLSEHALSDMVDRIEYIKLETSNRSLLNQIAHIDIQTDKIAISDSRKCILYSKDGKYIRTIGRNGRGAGEYASIHGISFLPDKEEIAIRDRKELLIYSIYGEFRHRFKLPILLQDNIVYSVGKYIPVTDSTFLGYLPNTKGVLKFKAILFDRDGEIIHKYPNYIFFDRKKEYITSHDYDINLYRIGNTILFKECLNDTLFYMKGNDLILEYIFDLGKYSMPTSVRESDPSSYFTNSENYITIRNVFESPKYIFLECDLGKYSPTNIKQTNQYNPKYCWGLLNKVDNSFTFIKPTKNKIYPTGIMNDYDNGPNLYPQRIIMGNTLLSWIDAYRLKAHVASEVFKNSKPKYPEKKKELERLANSLDGNDNPVLMLVTLKE